MNTGVLKKVFNSFLIRDFVCEDDLNDNLPTLTFLSTITFKKVKDCNNPL